MNTLYYGDNLKILRERIQDKTVDLIYLDPPFNSNRNYNVLFKDESGAEAEAQITAFEDTWHWTPQTELAYHELVTNGADNVSRMIEALRQFIGTNQMMAYLVMMAARLVELHRVLKPTGSLYLHCDPTASHYLKIILDTIFGAENYRNEITWKRHSAHNNATKNYAIISDSIFYYVKSDKATFKTVFSAYSDGYIKKFFTKVDEKGRRYGTNSLKNPSDRPNLKYDYKGYPSPPTGWTCNLEKMQEYDRQGRLEFPNDKTGRIRLRYYVDEMLGMPATNIWDDITPLSNSNAERLGYPTQKPVALLERIVQASSNEGDVVLDPFCGCGTTIAAAQKLNRRWIGIDITHLSIALQKYRLKDSFNLVEKKDYRVIGEPEDLQSARQLASEDRYQFQWWALSLVKARPLGASAGSKEGKKGSDKGIDGVITFVDDNSGKAKRVFVQVKSGKVKSGDIRDLVGTITRENGAIGVFITLENATRDMITEAATAGFYHSAGWHRDYPKMQIFTIEDLLGGKEIQMPPGSITFKQAERVSKSDVQPGFFDGQ